MSLVSFLISILNLAPSSRLRHLSIRLSFTNVCGLGSCLDSEPGSKLPFATLVDQIKPGSIDANPLNLASCIDSEPGSELPFGTPVDQTEPGNIDANPLNLASCIDSEPGSELPFATTLDQIELRGCPWSRC